MDNNELAHYVEKLKLGDISAFEVIYNETNNQVYNLLYSYTKNQETSFDLMQETYLTVNNKIGTIKDPHTVKSWINRIAINKANRFFEKNKKEILLSEEGQALFETQLEEDEEFLPQEILDSKEKQKIIKDIIDNLPLEQKTAVYLYYFDELSLTDVAEDMKCSEGTVKSRLNYARKKIKAEVDTWEKKGTKLYGTGVPVLLLLLQNQLGIEQISLDKANVLLKNIVNGIGGSSAIGAIHQIGNASLSTKIKGASTAAKKVFGIKSAVSGAAATVVVASIIANNNKPVPVIQKKDVILSYSQLSMDNGISTINVLGDDIVFANDLPDDKCIQIVKKDSVEDGQAEIKVISVDGNENIIKAEINNNELSAENGGRESSFIAYKELTDGIIASISDYDENIVRFNNDPEKKHIEIIGLKQGNTKVKLLDNKGLKGELKIVVKSNIDQYIDQYDIDLESEKCK